MDTLPFDEAVTRLGDNEVRFDKFLNDAVGYMTRDGVSVESIIAFLDRLETEITGYTALDPRVTTLEGEMDDVETDVATIQAESAPIHDQIEVTTGDDEGLNLTGQLAVGKPGAGRETVLGGGDSYPVTKAWHVNLVDIVGLTVTNAVDVTTILQSDSGSSTGLFGSNVAGKVLLLMSDKSMFGGMKVKTDTLGVVEPGNIAFEYLRDNSPLWDPTMWMVTESDFPYSPKANVLSSVVGSEQWRLGCDPGEANPSWDEVTLNIDGTDYTGRFLRARTTSAITTDPVIQQIKLHSDRWECNADGNTEYFGKARYPKDLHFHKSTNAAKAPADENILIAAGVTILEDDNEFTAAAADGNVYQFAVPNGLDTSIPIVIEKRFYPNAATAGDIKYDCDVYKIHDGDVLDGTATASATLSNLISVNNQDKVLMKTTFEFSIADLLPGDTVVLAIGRDGPDGTDTFGSSIVDVSGRAVGYFWRP